MIAKDIHNLSNDELILEGQIVSSAFEKCEYGTQEYKEIGDYLIEIIREINNRRKPK